MKKISVRDLKLASKPTLKLTSKPLIKRKLCITLPEEGGRGG